MQRIMYEKYAAPPSSDPSPTTTSKEVQFPPPVIIHGPTSWEQHLRSKMHRKMRTNKAEMERDGANWWYFKAQEYKKRKREGTLNQEVEVVGGVLEDDDCSAEEQPISKARRTDVEGDDGDKKE